MLARAQQIRQEWESVTESTRRIAIAADTELRRRHPGMRIEPLSPHSAESRSARQPQADRLTYLGLTLETAEAEIPAALYRVGKDAAIAQHQIDNMRNLRLPAWEPDEVSPDPAWPEQPRQQRDAVLQPPQHEMTPSSRLGQHCQAADIHAQAEREMEAE